MIKHTEAPVLASIWKFPCHGICNEDNLVVFFTNNGNGIVVDIGKSNSYSIGCVTRFVMNRFTPCAKGTSTTFTDE
jgi:hypothetical protein